MNQFKNILSKYMNEYNIYFDDIVLDRFEKYADFLVLWNQKMNLTSITDMEGIIVKHFIDSLMILNFAKIPENTSFIDVGTGAGFPGIPLKIARPDIKLTLLDSLNKRLTFLRELLNELQLDAQIIHGRAEEIARLKEYREGFDFVVSRAVAPLNVLSEYCVPFVKMNGFFIALKGPNLNLELESAERSINILGGKVEKVEMFELPGKNSRSALLVKKVEKTSEKYPRHGSKISKKSL